MSQLTHADILLVGTGVMGIGIAQVAILHAHRVFLYDKNQQATQKAYLKVIDYLHHLGSIGQMTSAEIKQFAENLIVVEELGALKGAVALVIEAVSENLELKQQLYMEIEPHIANETILATNTSALSISALARGLKVPSRLVGVHFFNPVTKMKLVEIVAGLQTDAKVVDSVLSLMQTWGKIPVRAKSSPGFIVNRIARSFYAETWALLLEQASQPARIDQVFRSYGFRMGPCELMDLIGHDTNFAVTQAVYAAYFYDKRYYPSVLQAEMVAGGLFGRKSGRGFYYYQNTSNDGKVDKFIDSANETYSKAFQDFKTEMAHHPLGLAFEGGLLFETTGPTASSISQNTGIQNVLVLDVLPDTLMSGAHTAVAFSRSPACSKDWLTKIIYHLTLKGLDPIEVADTPALIVARTLATIINEAADTVLQGICSIQDSDKAMVLGMNFPQGPFSWLNKIGETTIISIIFHLKNYYFSEKYRLSPWFFRKDPSI